MAPKKAAVEAVIIDKEKLAAVVEQLSSGDRGQVLEAVQLLLRGTEESMDLKYEMVEKNVAGLVLQLVDNEDSEIQLAAVRVLARYATYQGKLRKVTCGSSVVTRLWDFLPQYQREMEAKEEHERKEAEAGAGAGESAAPVEAAAAKDPKKDKGLKDKKGSKSKGKEAAVAESGPQFHVPSAELLEAVLRGLNTMAMVDTKVITRIISFSSIGALMHLMRHPHPLIKERSWKLASTMCRNTAASVAMYDAGMMDVVLPDLEVMDIPTRLKAVDMLTKMANLPDSRLERMEEAGVPQTLYRYMSGLDPLNAPPREEVKEGTKGGKGKGGKAPVEEVTPEQSPEMHALQAACARLLSIIAESVPSTAEYAVSYNGLDVLAALLPAPVQKQLEKYGLPLLPVVEPEPSHSSAATGEEEEEEGEDEGNEAAELSEAPSTPPDAVLQGMLATKAEREAEERAKAEAEERRLAEEKRQREEEEAVRADWEANVKGLPKAKPESSAVQEAVLRVLRTALQSAELRERMQEAPWPQILLHLLHAPDPEAAPVARVEEVHKATKKGGGGGKGGKEGTGKGKGGKDAPGPKSGKTSKSLDVTAEVEEVEKEWHDPLGPLYPPFDNNVRAGAVECASELLSDWGRASPEMKHFTVGQELLWMGRAVDHLRSKTEPLDPLDVTLATRLALALGDVGLMTPEEELLKSDYIKLVKNFAVLAHQANSRHLREAVGRASLALPGDEHFTAVAEPPAASPAPTPQPDPLVTSKYMWDAYGKPVNVDGFVLQPAPLESA